VIKELLVPLHGSRSTTTSNGQCNGRELDEYSWFPVDVGDGETPSKSAPASCRSMTASGYDACAEYSCVNDSDDENDESTPPLTSGGHPSSMPFSALFYDHDDEAARRRIHPVGGTSHIKDHGTQSGSRRQQGVAPVSYILGRQFHPIKDYDSQRDDELSLFWWTYRSDFEVPIEPYGITTDAGWGCMVRAIVMNF
jgi:Peptidase family C54